MRGKQSGVRLLFFFFLLTDVTVESLAELILNVATAHISLDWILVDSTPHLAVAANCLIALEDPLD